MDTARLLWLLCAALTSVVARDPYYFAVDGEIVLEPISPPDKIERVVWKYGVNLLADLTRGRLNYYGQFKDSASLEASGRLTIKNAKPSYNGPYSVEVNNQVQGQQYDVRVINKVSRPTIKITPLTCSHSSASCVLVCNVDSAEPVPVSYQWLIGTELSEETGQELTIKPADDLPPTYTCRAKNPVSQADSESVKNPFIPPPPPPPYWVIGLVVGLAIIALVAGLAWWKKDVIRDGCQKVGVDGSQTNNSNSNRVIYENEPLKSNEPTTEKIPPSSEARIEAGTEARTEAGTEARIEAGTEAGTEDHTNL